MAPAWQRPIKPEWLLRQADDLGGRNAGVGQPRNADLRRAVSAAYYALYHHVVGLAVNHAIPDGKPAEQAELSRLFTHAAVKTVCEQITSARPPPASRANLLGPLKTNVALRDAALAFVPLQQARHDADYNHQAAFSRAGVLTLVDSARDAIKKLDLVTGTRDGQTFLALIMLEARRQ